MTLKEIKDKKSLLAYLTGATEKDAKFLAEVENVVAFTKAKAKVKASIKAGVDYSKSLDAQLLKVIKFDGGRDFLEVLTRTKSAAPYKEYILTYLSKH